MNRHIHTFMGCESEYGDARIVLFGAPFDGTTSFRPGARFAGAAMRGDSYGLETYSPYQDRDLREIAVFDGESWSYQLAIPNGCWIRSNPIPPGRLRIIRYPV